MSRDHLSTICVLGRDLQKLCLIHTLPNRTPRVSSSSEFRLNYSSHEIYGMDSRKALLRGWFKWQVPHSLQIEFEEWRPLFVEEWECDGWSSSSQLGNHEDEGPTWRLGWSLNPWGHWRPTILALVCLSLWISVCEGKKKNLRPSITHLVEITTLGDLLLSADYNYATTTTQWCGLRR